MDEQLKQKVDTLIDMCNTDNVRKSVGKILSLPMTDINLLLEEFNRKPDIRFGDNLISACKIVKIMRRSWDWGSLFAD